MAMGLSGSRVGFALTPHKVSLCILARLCVPEDNLPLILSEQFQRQLLSSFLIKLCTASDNFLEPTLQELIRKVRRFQHEIQEDIVRFLVHQLKTLLSPNDLVDLFLGLRDLLARSGNEESDMSQLEGNEKKLNPNSVLGRFIRRCVLSFNLTSFEATCQLLTNVTAYCSSYIKFDPDDPLYFTNSSMKTMSKEIASDFGIHDDPVDAVFNIRHPFTWTGKRSRKKGKHNVQISQHFSEPDQGNEKFDSLAFLQPHGQVDSYLREEADLIENNVALVPMNQFEGKLNKLKKLAPDLTRVYYLRYLNSLYHGDYLSALNNFHQYFDYSAGKEAVGNNGAFSNGRFQAVLLSMGTMHSLLGHPTHALVALTGAIQEAQRTSDNHCLAHILAALCFLFSEIGVPNNSSDSGLSTSCGIDMGGRSSLAVQQQLPILLKRCLSRAVELRLTHLVLFSHLALAKFDLKHVQKSPLSFGMKISTKLRTCPVNVCKDLRLSCYALSESGIDSMCTVTGASLTDLSTASFNMPSGSFLLGGDDSKCHGPIPRAILQLSGNSYLTRSMSWEMYGSAPLVRLNALIHAICYADGASADDLSLAYVKLIQHLAHFKGYKEAFAALNVIEKKFSSVYKSRIRLLKLQLIHNRALDRGYLKLAQHACNQLSTLVSPLSGVDMDLKVEATLRHAQTLLAAQQYSEAATVAQSLFSTCYKYNMQVESTNVLLLIGEIHKKSGNPISGLPYVLASLSLCQSFNLDLLQATSILSLAELWLSLGSSHAKHALALVHQGLPIILGHGGLQLRAQANLFVAKCYLATSDYSVTEEPYTVLNPLKQAAKEFEILECHELAGEAFYLIAIIYNFLGKLVERDLAASSFQRHVLEQNHIQMQEPSMLSL